MFFPGTGVRLTSLWFPALSFQPFLKLGAAFTFDFFVGKKKKKKRIVRLPSQVILLRY